MTMWVLNRSSLVLIVSNGIYGIWLFWVRNWLTLVYFCHQTVLDSRCHNRHVQGCLAKWKSDCDYLMNPFHPFPILANGRLMFQFFSGYWILRNLHETCGHCLPQTLEHQGLAEYPWTCGGLGSTSTARAGLQSLEWRYPLVIQHSYRKLPFIVDLPIKHCDFPVRKVLVYQRVYPLAIKQTMENHLHWGDVPLQRLIAGR